MSLVTSGRLTLKATQTEALDLANATFPASLGLALSLSDGTAANQADLLFSDTRTTATEELDLAGSLSDAYGNTLTFARVKGILIKAASDNAVDVHVGGAATNAFATFVGDASDEIVVKAGGAMFLWAPDATAYAVTASTGDLLKVAASDGTTSITYDIIVIGASA